MGLYRVERRSQYVAIVLELPKFIEHVRQDCGGGNLASAVAVAWQSDELLPVMEQRG